MTATGNQRRLAVLFVLLLLALCWHNTKLLPSDRNLPEGSSGTQHKHPSTSTFTHRARRRPQTTSIASPLPHTIDTLIRQADDDFDALLGKESDSLAAAAEAYRQTRGRHPPPGFDLWYKFAKEKNAVVVEEFWDQIYHDLNPFWGIPAKQIRVDAKAYDMVVNVRGGRAQANTGWFWHQIWANMIDTVSEHLPDMVVPANSMDEPRMLVPWETINDYMSAERSSRVMIEPTKAATEYNGWHKDESEEEVYATDLKWDHSMPYTYSRRTCNPDSAIRQHRDVPQVSELLRQALLSHQKHPQKDVDFALPHTQGGFVSNYTMSTLICHQPDLGAMHGALIQPLTSSSTKQLIPLFGGSKFAANNDILLPAPMYWSEEERFNGGADVFIPWSDKIDKVIWRGTATGGHNTAMNWKQFHRHRFVALTNGTKYELADKHYDEIFTSWLRLNSINSLQTPFREHLADWLKEKMDVGFTDLMCDASEEDASCWYTSDEYEVLLGVQMQYQFQHKYLPDIDGNSFSGRYRAFLQSTSLPIKATLYREWHDSRLVAWKHFVPMDNRFGDFYGIMEYFQGFEEYDQSGSAASKGHDAEAEKIAIAGREWAQKVLRKEDMAVYVFRLLLEYARLTDDRRDQLGYVDDLLPQSRP